MTPPIIRLQDVRFRWARREPLVLNIESFEVASTESVLIQGPSGSGKTTLLNLLGGVVTPEAGEVAVMETDLGALSGAGRDAFRADHIGFLFQQFNLLPYLPLIDNVILPCHFSDARRAKAEGRSPTVRDEAVRLLASMELDVDALAGRPVSRLSIGQQQRAAAARSLIGAPDLIIADEPTSSLDAVAQQAFLDLLFEEARTAGSTLVFVSHDSTLAPSFDRVVSLGDLNRADEEA